MRSGAIDDGELVVLDEPRRLGKPIDGRVPRRLERILARPGDVEHLKAEGAGASADWVSIEATGVEIR